MTKEQKFWEKCGVHVHTWVEPTEDEMFSCFPGGICSSCKEPQYDYDIETRVYTPKETMPPINLITLFKYAVPEAIALEWAVHINYIGNDLWQVEIDGIHRRKQFYCQRDKDPAQALYQALCKALGVEE